MSILDWLSPPSFERDELNQLGRNLYSFLLTTLGGEFLCLLVIPLISPENPGSSFVILGGVILYTLMCYVVMRLGRLRLAGFLFCILLSGITIGLSLITNGPESIAAVGMTIVVLIAAILLGTQYSFLFALLGFLSLLILFFAANTALIPFQKSDFSPLAKIIAIGLMNLLIVLLLRVSDQNTKQAVLRVQQKEDALKSTNEALEATKKALENQLEQQTRQLQTSLEISQTISQILDPEQFAQRTTQKLTTLFAYEVANLYLLDKSERWAELNYSYPETSSKTLQRIDLSKPSSLANALRTRSTQIIQNPVRSASNVQTELILPLLTRGKPLGALSLQSVKHRSLTGQELDILTAAVNQIALAWENINLFHETQQQLQEINHLNQTYLQSTWQSLLAPEVPAFRFSNGTVSEIKVLNETALEIAQKVRKIHIKNENGNSTLIAPIMFQNQVLGAIELTSPARVWTNDELIMIEAILNQTALSLENTRLIIETRNRAEQEKMIGDIANRIRETLDLETILQTSVQEMRKNLKLSEVQIRLSPSMMQEPAEPRYPISVSGE
ncbi:MAG: hypothetical protein Fur0022_12760 [Anaerolineales bacterium]